MAADSHHASNVRQEAVARLRARLTQHHSPRLTMLLVVVCAAGAGFLSSALMLWMRISYMPVRYAVASLLGYAVFLGLMNRWLGYHAKVSAFDRATDVIDPLDIGEGLLRSGASVARRTAEGVFGGGRSGGAGASASFDAAGITSSIPPPPVLLASGSGGGSKGSSMNLDLDDVGVLPIIAIVAIGAGVVACASVVISAPQMLAELMVDGAIAGAAYHQLKGSTKDWTIDVFRRTWIPATVLMVTFVLLGFAGHWLKPGADSIGDFFR